MAKQSNKKEEQVQDKKDPFKEEMLKLEQKFGKGTVQSGQTIPEDYEIVSTGSLLLDIALGTGGYVLGTLVEMVGPFSSGKSTLTLHAIANFQKAYPDDEVILIDGEHSYDVKYARKLKVDTNKIHIIQPRTSEDMYNIADPLIRTGRVRLVVIDSHTSVLPNSLVSGEVGQTTIAPYGRINSVALGKVKGLLKPNRCTIIALSQTRVAVGGYTAAPKSTGGSAWEFYPDVKIRLQKKEVSAENEMNKTVATVTKNKLAKPMQQAEFNILWNHGIDRVGEIIDCAVEFKLIEKGGSWYTLAEGVKVQGEDAVRQFMLDNENWALTLEEAVIEKLREADGK